MIDNPPKDNPALSIIIFAQNERDNVPSVVDELRRWIKSHNETIEIVFVDDGSTDDTFKVAKAELTGCRFRLIRHEYNQGIGVALRSGIRSSSAPLVTFMPADGQIPPTAIDTLWQSMKQNGGRMVFSEYLRRDDGVIRSCLSFGVRALIWLIHGVKLRSEGPYLFHRQDFLELDPKSKTFFLNFEFPILLLRAGYCGQVVQVPCRSRLSGHSKSANLRKIWLVFRELVLMRLATRR